MKVFTRDEVSQSDGRMILAYGETNVGKTASTLLTAPDPIFHIQFEHRNLKPTMDLVKELRPDLKIHVCYYENFSDTMEFLSRGDKTDPAAWKLLMESRTILGDSLTDLMAIKLNLEIQDEAYEARSEAEKRKKQLIGHSKLTQEGYGSVASLSVRFTNAIARFASQLNKYVILLARLDEHPSWGVHYDYAPLLKGKEYGKDFKGMFDLIGFVQGRMKFNEHNQVIGVHYPPGIAFGPDDGSFMCKWTGPGETRRFKMDWKKILGVD